MLKDVQSDGTALLTGQAQAELGMQLRLGNLEEYKLFAKPAFIATRMMYIRALPSRSRKEIGNMVIDAAFECCTDFMGMALAIVNNNPSKDITGLKPPFLIFNDRMTPGVGEPAFHVKKHAELLSAVTFLARNGVSMKRKYRESEDSDPQTVRQMLNGNGGEEVIKAAEEGEKLRKQDERERDCKTTWASMVPKRTAEEKARAAQSLRPMKSQSSENLGWKR